MSRNFSLTRSRLWRTRAATALAAAGALVMSGGLVVLAASTASGNPPGQPGNNGTVKVGDDGDIDEGRPENDPHLPCTFNIQWFNFDAVVGYDITSDVTFELQDPTAENDGVAMSVVSGDQHPVITSNGGKPGAGEGYDRLVTYTLSFTGPPHEQQGYHVKITVDTPYSKGAVSKHKVFWVGPCGRTDRPLPNPPVPTAPDCDTDGSLTLPPDNNGLTWSIVRDGGASAGASPYGPGVYDVTVTSSGLPFVNEGQSHTFQNITVLAATGDCETRPVPPAPTPTAPGCDTNGSLTLPAPGNGLTWSIQQVSGTTDTTSPYGPGVYSVTVTSSTVPFTGGTSMTHTYPNITVLAATGNCPANTRPIPAAPAPTTPSCDTDGSLTLPANTDNLTWSIQQVSGATDTTSPYGPGVYSVTVTSTSLPFAGSQSFTHTYPNITVLPNTGPCIAGVEEISPDVTFTEPDCDNLDGADWSGNFTDVVDYAVDGTPGLGESVTVTATIKASAADSFAFPAGFDNTFDHTYVTEAELACPTVKGSESVRPKPHTPQPTVLGTQAVAPTAVNAGLTSLPSTGASSNTLLAQLMVGGGMLLLLAGGWLGFGRREYGAHQA